MMAPLDVTERLGQLQQSMSALRLYALVDGAQYRMWRGEAPSARPGYVALFAGTADQAIRLGFRSTTHIVRLMYLASDAPGILQDQLVDAYLRKSGATPEQRLDDMLALMNKKLERNY